MSLFTDIKTLLNEPNAGVFWTDQYIYDAANEAQLDLWADTKWATTTATLTITATLLILGQLPPTVIPVQPLPTTAIMIPQYFVGTAGKYYTTTPARLEQWSRQWQLSLPDYPKHLVLWDWSHVRPVPIPDINHTYPLVGIGWPPSELGVFGTSTVQDITAPRLLKRAIAYQAAASLIEHTHPDLADAWTKESFEALTEFKVQLRNQQSHNIRRLRPGTLFTGAQSGNVKLGQNLS